MHAVSQRCKTDSLLRAGPGPAISYEEKAKCAELITVLPKEELTDKLFSFTRHNNQQNGTRLSSKLLTFTNFGRADRAWSQVPASNSANGLLLRCSPTTRGWFFWALVAPLEG